jgi:exopolysaccharide production protein ExoQ
MMRRTIQPAFLVLILLSLWSPNEAFNLPAWSDMLRYAVFLLMSACIIAAAYFAVGLRFPSGMVARLVAGFLLYLCLSAFWGSQDADSYLKCALILSAGLTSLSVANTTALESTLRIVFCGHCIFLILSVLVVVLLSTAGIDNTWEHAGKWHGLAGQKNGFGVIAAFTAICALGLPLKLRRTRGKQITNRSSR